MSDFAKTQAFSHTLAVDTPVAMLIWCVGATGTTTVDNVGGSYDFIQDGSADTTVNTTGTIVESDDGATIGAFADLVEAQAPTEPIPGKWHCTIVAALRASDTTACRAIAAADALEAGGGVEILWDIGVLEEIFICHGVESDGNQPTPNGRLSSRNRTGDGNGYGRPLRYAKAFNIEYLSGNTDGDSVTTVRVYSSTQAADVLLETLATAADDVQGSKSYNAGQEPQSWPGHRLVIRISEAGTSAPDALTGETRGGYGDAPLTR